ncbi:phage recombination protein [Proteus vulgaris]|uniref:Phage recombination protein n=1 Tax=Proteus vulgaris TaxID=585 RepID=A0A379FCI1_PROVU|nr:phage protein NinX family protein [Proteus vulgaris]SUC17316.1 phage recombination protein [Proteus vulgaris]
MNKYTELSDFEINKKVADKLGLLPYLFIANDVGELIWDVPSNDNYHGFISKRGCELDFCYNPSNAMPIIIENEISMIKSSGDWMCGSGWNVAENKNPLRAAMEVFLMMKEAENEKV